ncbi:MAG: 4-hydroxy-tetrahydrodipicolinate reductase [Holosporaceae bacterium]|jgi:4-hydroxy-tetrahydrodipicolinate reductase|nr:4-hydroxy-tetrahydrodipicolinate reductase [Holosporaceae bacterium]
MKKIGIIGITGRIGTLLEELLRDSLDFSLYGGIASKSSGTDLQDIVQNSDILVDFSRPAATLQAAELASRYGTPLVTGTTGIAPQDFEKIRSYSRSIPILHSSNFSEGIQLMAILLKKCSVVLSDFDFSIIDYHHRKKKDAPSGTALFLAEQVKQKAQIVSLRSGNVPGDHICDFCSDDEMLSISHRVFNRQVFAHGALKCASWLINKNPGMYNMADYLEEKIGDRWK